MYYTSTGSLLVIGSWKPWMSDAQHIKGSSNAKTGWPISRRMWPDDISYEVLCLRCHITVRQQYKVVIIPSVTFRRHPDLTWNCVEKDIKPNNKQNKNVINIDSTYMVKFLYSWVVLKNYFKVNFLERSWNLFEHPEVLFKPPWINI